MLELRGISVHYGQGKGNVKAVDDVSLTLPVGGTFGLVGESGSGKSSVARGILGLAPIVTGQVLLGGEDWTAAQSRNSSRYRQLVQMVFQDPYSTFSPRMRMGEVLADALAAGGVGKRNREKESVRFLDIVGISSKALHQYPHEFSGGQRQRIAIARALCVQPKVLVLDEVTSALDVSVQAVILNLLNDLQRQYGFSMLFISHDLDVVSMISDVVGVMYMGRIVESAPNVPLFSSPCHPYTRALMASIPTFGGEMTGAILEGELPDPNNPPQGCRFNTRCPSGPLFNEGRTICLEQDPQMRAAERQNHAACHFVELAHPG